MKGLKGDIVFDVLNDSLVRRYFLKQMDVQQIESKHIDEITDILMSI